MFALPHYPTLSETSNVTRSPSHSDSHPPRKPTRSRPRGHDGRFVPKATVEHCVEEQERKVCGWCHTSDTSQWRVGPTDGSAEMGTLCNACGINYRRALVKSATGRLNLDSLARDMGPSRPSIQKALKRQRKQMKPPSPSKRARPSNKFARRALSPLSPLSLRALPNSSISMLLCDASSLPASEKREVYYGSSNVYSAFPQKHFHDAGCAGTQPAVGRFLEEPIWDRSPTAPMAAALQTNSVLPPIQSLLRCIDQTTAVADAPFRPTMGFLQH